MLFLQTIALVSLLAFGALGAPPAVGGPNADTVSKLESLIDKVQGTVVTVVK